MFEHLKDPFKHPSQVEFWGPKTLAWARNTITECRKQADGKLCLADYDDDGGYLLLHTKPPVEKIIPSPEPWVFVVGSFTHAARVRAEAIIKKLKIPNTHVLTTTETGLWFWRKFFGRDDFLDSPTYLPSLIITNGAIRMYEVGGSGQRMTIKCLRLIKEHAKHWNVPVRVIRDRGW